MKVENIKITKVGYGHYNLTGIVEGEKVSLVTTDSNIYDWLDDDENEEKHLTAIADAERMLIDQFKAN